MFTIGKLASLTDVSHDTLRYYEKERLVRPAGKSPAGYRLYDKDAVRRIQFIKLAQRCDLTLAEIRELLMWRGANKARRASVRSRAIGSKARIENALRAMQAMSKALDDVIADCANGRQPANEWTIIAALQQATDSMERSSVSENGRT